MVDSGSLNIGDMMSFIQYSSQVMVSFLMLSMMFILIPRASVSAGRINDILKTTNSIKDSELAIDKLDNVGTIEFKDVSFKHGDSQEMVLSNINFKISSEKVTAIIGSTGSGKSTIVNLIMRFYDVSEGEIIFDGINIKDIKLKTLRNKIGYVPQKGVLFSGTILSNLKYGKKKATNKEVEEALTISESIDFVMNKKGKLKSLISQGATNISGGQKQRLSIARAIIKQPEIIVFDDSFSALDYKTDARLRKSLNKYLTKTTIIIVAQRISTIMNADQIIVLDEGKIVGIGKHKELLKSCKIYKEIALSQLSKEELL